jgi:protoporphyrinogen oxidase
MATKPENGTDVEGTTASAQRGIATGHRRVRLTGKPSLSVVLASTESLEALAKRLDPVVPRCEALGIEIVVAFPSAGEPEGQGIALAGVRLVPCPVGSSTEELRAAGMKEAEGDLVTIVEDVAAITTERLGPFARFAAIEGEVPAVRSKTGPAPDGPPPGRQVDRLRPGQHVVIIGAGPGGLTAAWLLAKRGVKVTVLEADDMVGGISRTARYKGYRFDIGGHRFFTKIEPVQAVWKEILGEDFISVPRLSRIHYRGRFFDYPLKAGNALSGLGIWTAIRIMVSYIRAHLWPNPVEENLEQWVTNRFGKRLYEIFFKTYTEKVWGLPCTEIRAEWAAQRIQNLSLAKAILNAANINRRSKDVKSLIHEFEYPRFGPGQMWETCRDKTEALGGRVLMRHAVTGFEVCDRRVVAVSAETPDGNVRIEADHFISTMPIRSLVQSLSPQVPPQVRAAANGLRYRDFLTVALIMDRDDLFPDNWIYIHTPGVKVGRVQNFNNWSRAMVPDEGHTCLGLEYFCFEGDGLWTSADEDLIALATKEVRELGLDKGATVVDGAVVRMPKAYPVYDSMYREHLDVVREHLDAIPNLHPVGRNGMHKYNNQDHSMLTAMMALDNMDGATHDVWAVNTDFEYHEEQRVERGADAQPAARAS